MPNCPCQGTGWICEKHDRPSCDCGAPPKACSCNPHGLLPSDFRSVVRVEPPFSHANIEAGDWIKYDIGNGKTQITEVQNFYGGGGGDRVSMVTPDGYVHFADVTEVRRGAPRSAAPAKVTPIRRTRR